MISLITLLLLAAYTAVQGHYGFTFLTLAVAAVCFITLRALS